MANSGWGTTRFIKRNAKAGNHIASIPQGLEVGALAVLFRLALRTRQRMPGTAHSLPWTAIALGEQKIKWSRIEGEGFYG